MRIPKKLFAEILDTARINEGFRNKPYLCPSQKLTIGFGRNIQDRGITREEGEFLLENDVEIIVAELCSAFPWAEELMHRHPDKFKALCDMAFMGLPQLKRFRKMLAAIEKHDWITAGVECRDSAYWRTQCRKRAERNALDLEGTE